MDNGSLQLPIYLYPPSTQEEIPLTFKYFTNIYGWPNMGSLRALSQESERNGLDPAFLKFGKRRFVLPQTLFRLLKESQ